MKFIQSRQSKESEKPLSVLRTLTARAKLKEIYRYSLDKWGEKVARKYMADIEAEIKRAARRRGGAKKNQEFSARFTYSRVRRHYIFFDVKQDSLIIATIFHAGMHIKERMHEEMRSIEKEINKIVE